LRKKMGRKEKEEQKINVEDKKLLEWVKENGWEIFNGMKGDEEGEFTFTGGRRNTTIDFVLGDEEVRKEINGIRIGDRIDLDHQWRLK